MRVTCGCAAAVVGAVAAGRKERDGWDEPPSAENARPHSATGWRQSRKRGPPAQGRFASHQNDPSAGDIVLGGGSRRASAHRRRAPGGAPSSAGRRRCTNRPRHRRRTALRRARAGTRLPGSRRAPGGVQFQQWQWGRPGAIGAGVSGACPVRDASDCDRCMGHAKWSSAIPSASNARRQWPGFAISVSPRLPSQQLFLAGDAPEREGGGIPASSG